MGLPLPPLPVEISCLFWPQFKCPLQQGALLDLTKPFLGQGHMAPEPISWARVPLSVLRLLPLPSMAQAVCVHPAGRGSGRKKCHCLLVLRPWG